MDDIASVVLVLIFGGVVGFASGVSSGTSTIRSDCEKLGKFQSADNVYVCQKEEKK